MLTRRKWLRRTSFRRSTRRTKYRRRPREVGYMLFVKRLACSAAGLDPHSPCWGRVEADHVGPRGLGQKSDDRFVIPICSKHHKERGSFSGAFRDFDKARMRLFVAEALVRTQTAARELGVIQFAQPTVSL